MLKVLRIPERFWTFIAASWKRGDPSLYGRFDLRYDGQGPAKLLEYNADTPTSVFETAVFQWMWLEDAIARNHRPEGCRPVQFAARAADRRLARDRQRRATCISPARSPIRRTAAPSRIWRTPRGRRGSPPPRSTWRTSAARRRARSSTSQDKPIELLFKLYPWEWMFREQFGAYLAGSATRWLEPPWKAILSNKGILPLLWAMYPAPPEPAAGLFRRRSEGRRARQFVRAQAALFARGRQRRDRGRGRGGRSGRGPVRRGRLRPPGGRDLAAL